MWWYLMAAHCLAARRNRRQLGGPGAVESVRNRSELTGLEPRQAVWNRWNHNG